MSEHSRAAFFAVDRAGASVVVAPVLAGVREDARVAVYDHDAGMYVQIRELGPGEIWRLPLRELSPVSNFSIKLQIRDGDGWRDHVGPVRLRTLGDLSLASVVPSAWGVTIPCVVLLRDVYTRQELLRAAADPDDVVEHVLDGTGDLRRVQLDFFERGDDGRAGARLLPPIRLVPRERAGRPVKRLVCSDSGLPYARRRDVTLAPVALKAPPEGGLATYGFIGAWEAGEPVVEAMEFVLGRQRFLYHPEVPEVTERRGSAIYLGLPHGSWGHFLTQGLSRVWYALQHPSVPVVWDASRLHPYQERVLEILGMKNPQLFLREPMRFDEMVFPYPGIGLGDYVSADFARVIGRLRPQRVVPGKKIFLSRSGLKSARGGIEGAMDVELDRLAQAHGFSIFCPEQHPVEQQLAEMSSAEVVLGVEGSAFHSLLLLADPVETAFWALSRHRGGAGVYEHIKAAKGLRYETLNFLRAPMAGARGSIDLDLDGLDAALASTGGLTRDLHLLADRVESPTSMQMSYEAHVDNCLVRLGRLERDLAEAVLRLRAREVEAAASAISWYL